MKSFATRNESPTGNPLRPLEKEVYLELRDLKKELEGSTIMVGVSGGMDSMVLLNCLQVLRHRLGVQVHCIHVDHGVRAQSQKDGEFVEGFCRQNSIPFTMAKLELPQGASEDTLRQHRYEVFFKVSQREKANFVAVAHHKDDQLETRLMRLLQGTGGLGLSAMELLSSQKVLRPLLSFNRNQLKAYAKEVGLVWVEDETNQDTQKLRNWIRHDLLGLIKKDHPELLAPLSESLENLSEKKKKEASPTLDRHELLTLEDQDVEEKIYSIMRYKSSSRVTRRHVLEFKKRLKSTQKKFTFKMAGMLWNVNENTVFPLGK